MEYFRRYPSCIPLGTSHNSIYSPAATGIGTALFTVRAAIRSLSCGRMPWSFFYSNTVDSTWDTGSVSRVNMAGSCFEVVSASAAALDSTQNIVDMKPVLFGGRPGRHVLPRECFSSDEVILEMPENGYIMFSWALSAAEGAVLPSTPDTICTLYAAEGDRCTDGPEAFSVYRNSAALPLPDHFGAARPVSRRIAFIGDSITQGCGTETDGYEHWVARIALSLASEGAACWDLGMGYGRGADAATCGAWLAKAAEYDTVCVCFGVNDILWIPQSDLTSVYATLETIISALKAKGVRVLLLTVPPFDFEGRMREVWYQVNAAIRGPLGALADGVFDIAAILGRGGENAHLSAFGPHPNGEGGAAVAAAFVERYRSEWA